MDDKRRFFFLNPETAPMIATKLRCARRLLIARGSRLYQPASGVVIQAAYRDWLGRESYSRSNCLVYCRRGCVTSEKKKKRFYEIQSLFSLFSSTREPETVRGLSGRKANFSWYRANISPRFSQSAEYTIHIYSIQM